ncbi:gamma-glutamylcyclotransferase family protein [Halorussus aquaticus]|uniref:Putative gamma-glutamylcyclotransferase n=1 Tax=Halorussus aquaticus TaxID=2953748 RepID=A0ABD5Q2P5_9EURY|nr:gamma-glutamylcyclotransferase family protein [Halorussus aquaticus]
MDVFVYGTLTHPERVASVVSAHEFLGEATLHGLHRVDGRYPTLAPGGTVSGRVLRTKEIEALDAYEGVETGLYVRVSVPRDAPESDAAVAVYVGDPDSLGADTEWPGRGSFPERVRRFVRENGVVLRSRE